MPDTFKTQMEVAAPLLLGAAYLARCALRQLLNKAPMTHAVTDAQVAFAELERAIAKAEGR